MFSYEPFWQMLKRKNISTYALENRYGINKSEIYRLKHDHNFNVGYIDHLCALFNCQYNDVIIHITSKDFKKKPLTANIFSVVKNSTIRWCKKDWAYSEIF